MVTRYHPVVLLRPGESLCRDPRPAASADGRLRFRLSRKGRKHGVCERGREATGHSWFRSCSVKYASGKVPATLALATVKVAMAFTAYLANGGRFSAANG